MRFFLNVQFKGPNIILPSMKDGQTMHRIETIKVPCGLRNPKKGNLYTFLQILRFIYLLGSF